MTAPRCTADDSGCRCPPRAQAFQDTTLITLVIAAGLSLLAGALAPRAAAVPAPHATLCRVEDKPQHSAVTE